MGLDMKRFAETYLLEWKDRKRRKPLIIRGARQTGKTYLVEKFAVTNFENFIKVDFEFDVAAQSIFQSVFRQIFQPDMFYRSVGPP